MQSFTNFIEAKTADSMMRLHYLVQYTRGDVHDLMKSCLAMEPEREYIEARRLLKERYGQGNKIATALVEHLINGPPIKNKDCNALQKLSISLANCKNILQDVGYLNKVDNPDILQKIVRRLPHTLRRSWRYKADDITNNEHQETTFHDLAKFVDAKARAMIHPVFGDIKDDPRIGRKDSKGEPIAIMADIEGMFHQVRGNISRLFRKSNLIHPYKTRSSSSGNFSHSIFAS